MAIDCKPVTMSIPETVKCEECGFRDLSQNYPAGRACPKCGFGKLVLVTIFDDIADAKPLPSENTESLTTRATKKTLVKSPFENLPKKSTVVDKISQVADVKHVDPTDSPKPPPKEWDRLNSRTKSKWYDKHKAQILADIQLLGYSATLEKWKIGQTTMYGIRNRWSNEEKRATEEAKEEENNSVVEESKKLPLNEEIATWARNRSNRFAGHIFDTYIELQVEFCSPSALAQSLKELKDLVNKTNGSKEYITGAMAVINALERMFIRIDSLCPKDEEESQNG